MNRSRRDPRPPVYLTSEEIEECCMLPPDSSDDDSADDSDADPDYDPDLAHTNRLEGFMQSKYNNDEEMNTEEDNLAEIRNETSSQAEEEKPSTSTQAPRKTNKDKPPPPLWTNVDAAESVREPVIWKDTLPESTQKIFSSYQSVHEDGRRDKPLVIVQSGRPARLVLCGTYPVRYLFLK
ncbi:hypothetical protein J6590_053369 [Homalodisca vitripennis]|nr:hypothetical protein J6590_053369 [Homalodisca vitripennis]